MIGEQVQIDPLPTLLFREIMNLRSQQIHEWAKRKGFWPEDRPWNFGEKIALIHSELSEALEKQRAVDLDMPDPPDEHCPKFGGIAIELADAVIRIMDLAGAMQINLGDAIEAKMAFNENRPHKHGKAY